MSYDITIEGIITNLVTSIWKLNIADIINDIWFYGPMNGIINCMNNIKRICIHNPSPSISDIFKSIICSLFFIYIFWVHLYLFNAIFQFTTLISQPLMMDIYGPKGNKFLPTLFLYFKFHLEGLLQHFCLASKLLCSSFDVCLCFFTIDIKMIIFIFSWVIKFITHILKFQN